jgi:hypothetical protein
MPLTAMVTLFSGERVQGEFFVAAATPKHPGPETLLELLNDEARAFLPFQSEDGMLLLHRIAVRTIEFESDELAATFANPEGEHVYPLGVILRTETDDVELHGYCCTGNRATGSRRPLDLLNAPDMFVLLNLDGKLTLCNKNTISHATVD